MRPAGTPKGGSRAAAPVSFQASGADKDAIALSMGVVPEAEPDVYAFLCKALDSPLPHPWTEHADKKGRVFYWNPASRHSSWQHPLGPTHKSLLAAYRRIMKEEVRASAIRAELEAFQQQVEEEIGTWRQSHAPDGTPYFYKVGTQSTRWDNPRDELMGHMELRVKMLQDLAAAPAAAAAAVPTAGQVDLSRTQAFPDTAAAPIMDGTLSPGALADSEASPTDGTITAAGSPTANSRQLAIITDEDEKSDAEQHTSTIKSFLGLMKKKKKRKNQGHSSASSEASDSAASDTPLSASSGARSVLNFLSSGFGRKKREKDLKKVAVMRMSPKAMQRRELAAQRVGRAARRWLAWSRAKQTEAALTLQKTWRGQKGRKEWLAEWERQEAARRAANALPPELQNLERSLLEAMTSPLGKYRNRIAFERSKLLAMQGDPDLSELIVPDEIALMHGMNFDIPMDKAIFNIVRPLLLRPLPVPWQVLKRDSRRVDFYHAGVKEERRHHPLHNFFGEVITFLKAHVHTDVPMTEPMTAQIFREASPQFVRQRLGVWEGPHEDTTAVGGVRFARLVPGTDEDCAEGAERLDDPRLEAAANVTARLTAWLHLWIGFAPEEPFPFLEGRLPALAAQVSESVAVAPGAASKALLETLSGAPPLAVLAVPAHPVLDPKEPEVWPLTAEEEALQPIVVSALGRAYGSALAFVGRSEAESLEAARPVKPEVVDAEESEGEYTEIGEGEDYEDSFAEDEDDESSTSGSEVDDKEELSEDISAATTAAVTPLSGRRPMADVETLGSEVADDGQEEEEPLEVESFLKGYREQAASDWAARMLRPLTPVEERKPEPEPLTYPGSPGNRPWHRTQARAGERHLWGRNSVLPDSEAQLELKDPPLEDWGQGPASAVAAGEPALPTLPGGMTVPLSPKDRKRAAEALPHLAGPVQPDALAKLRQEQQEKVDAFQKSLMNATSVFDQTIEEADTPDGSLSPGAWRCGKRNPLETAGFSTGRSRLEKPILPANLWSEFDFQLDDDVCVMPGCIARASTPTKGALPAPPHLQGAKMPKKGSSLKAWPVHRSSSADAAMGKRSRRRPEELRPRSSRARVRPRCQGLLPERPSKVAEMAAQNCRRFLSRTCGTMQLALATFDSTGNGKINRWEFEAGLRKLDYDMQAYDVQEIFTILDKRRHHVLTLSDLLDHYKGVPIAEGMPDPGLGGIVSEVLHEAVLESLGPVLKQALSEMLEKELLAPRGPPWNLPNMKSWLKKQEGHRSRLSTDPNASLTVSDHGEERMSTKSSPNNRRRKTRHYDSASDFGHLSAPSRGNSSIHQSVSSKSPGRKSKKNITAFKAVGMLTRRKTRQALDGGTLSRSTSGRLSGGQSSGPLGSGQGQLATQASGTFAGSPHGTTRQKGMLGMSASSFALDQPAATGGSTAAPKPKRAAKDHGRSSPSARSSRSPHRPAGRGSKPAAAEKGAKSVAAGHPKNGAQKKSQGQQRGMKPDNKYVGYNFVKDEEIQEAMEEWEREKLLPWVPRPTEDICKTYGHIFRLLNDPRTRKMCQKPQKRSVHVSVPRMPSLPPGRGVGHYGVSDAAHSEDGSDGARQDRPAGLAPLPSLTGSKHALSKSTPDLFGSHRPGASASPSSHRPGSAGSQGSEDDPDRMRVSLPQLARGGGGLGKSASAAALLDPLGGPGLGAGARRRVPA